MYLGDYPSDFYLPFQNAIIESDGTRWHNYPQGREIDRIHEKELETKGYRVFRFWHSNNDRINGKYIRFTEWDVFKALFLP